MYNFSGVLFRIWGVCGAILLLGVICILLEKPWIKRIRIRDCKLGLIIIVFAIFLSLIYVSRIAFPHVLSYTGEFLETHRNSRVAPPLPVTYEYIFWNGEGKKHVFYLDVFAKKMMFPYEFVRDQKYTIYYDKLTNIIIKVEAGE